MGGCRAKKDCPYDAEKIYITNDRTGVAKGKTGWPADVVAQHPTVENVTEAIKTGPYGRCVYMCDNNVVDHQVVNMNMTDGTTMTLTMCAFDTTGSRYQKFMGTKGEIIADLSKNTINVTTFGGKPYGRRIPRYGRRGKRTAGQHHIYRPFDGKPLLCTCSREITTERRRSCETRYAEKIKS